MRNLLKVVVLILTAVVAPLTSGCSSKSTRTVETTETVSHLPSETHVHTSDETTVVTQPAQARTTETRTETTETESDDGGCGGVLSCTVEVLGEIIALPFRAVGALIRAIF